MPDTLTITDNRTGKQYEVPISYGTYPEYGASIPAADLRKIKASEDDFGLLGYDPGFKNTASCNSAVTFIDGDKGILHYRGYPIEELAEKSSFLEVAYLILNGELPTAATSWRTWTHDITYHTYRAREHQEVHGRLPPRCPPHGHAGEHGGGAVHLLSRVPEHRATRTIGRSRSGA